MCSPSDVQGPRATRLTLSRSYPGRRAIHRATRSTPCTRNRRWSTITPMHRYVSRVVDLIDPATNRVPDWDLADLRRIVFGGDPRAIRAIDGSFAVVASEGSTVRMAR